MKWLTVKPLLWICAALLAVIGVLSGVIWANGKEHTAAMATCEAERDTAQTQLSAAEGALETAIATNARGQKAIEDLASKLDAAISETERLDHLLLAAETELGYTQNARDTLLARLETERGAIYANDPTCAAWADAPVCGRISGGLQEQWRAASAARRR